MKEWIKNRLPIYWVEWIKKSRYKKEQSSFNGFDHKTVFKKIFQEKHWGEGESISGPGSSKEQTSILIKPLQQLLTDYSIQSILDVPCGDFNWMQAIDLSKVDYLGADIVPELIAHNKESFEKANLRFEVLDLIEDALPRKDLILIRDCLNHFSFKKIHKAIKNLKASQSDYLLLTSFTDQPLNYDITTGDWRALNLEKAPFNFPKPILTIKEYCPQGLEKAGRGKTLGLWKIADL